MATIHDLNTSILDMSREEAFKLIREIRQERLKPPKKKKVVRKTSGGSKPRAKKDPLKGVSKEKLLQLLMEATNDG